MKKNIYLLGATGSIGIQTLEVLEEHKDHFELITLALGKNIKKAIPIIEKFKPKFVSVSNEEDVYKLRELYPTLEVGYGLKGLVEAATYNPNNEYLNLVVNAVVGSVGLQPTIEAIKLGYDIALANKETLVTAGHIVMELAKKHRVKILPIDSEHSAIFQCMNGEDPKMIKQLIITASGGAFRDLTRKELEHVTLEEALNHPNWSMGQKITIDSATMMNKGLEVIEAHWLFDCPYENIKTILHRESIIHSMIEFQDHSIIAQLGTPSMKIPIQYALTYPNRKPSSEQHHLNLEQWQRLHFDAMDLRRYPCLAYAYEAGKCGGSLPTVLNAANEACVSLFLQNKISFLDIERWIYNELEQHKVIENPSLETVLTIDEEVKTRILLKGDSLCI